MRKPLLQLDLSVQKEPKSFISSFLWNFHLLLESITISVYLCFLAFSLSACLSQSGSEELLIPV